MRHRSAGTPTERTANRRNRILLGSGTLFLLLCAAHLLGHAVDAEALHRATKPLLIPALMAVVVARRGPGLLLVALAGGWAGDVLLMPDHPGAFLGGMAAFGLGHLGYLTLCRRAVRRGSSPTPARIAGAACGYTVVGVLVVVLLWPGLPAELRIPVAGYAVLLTATACAAALALGPRGAAGGGLFLLSDALIAAGIADGPVIPAQGFIIMSTYLAAQWLLADAVLLSPAGARGVRPGHGPGRRDGRGRRGGSSPGDGTPGPGAGPGHGPPSNRYGARRRRPPT
ncbi:lysoplasmalogenase [Streptomyces sp. ST2-7A]|uniref:lysoplasmalogenase n=1 Tax=Streptomyces sp. ST2-7A TaxID=2907214 RepID=UPI001F428C67|nr:lysoplasmalogenase [Streptomyces sp. ST2-7A]MCE7081048.1 lysoplasmalogenase [Streptomyces sp. ST2-7A]